MRKLKEENYQLQKNCQICENFIDEIPCKPLRDMDYDFQKVINQRDKYKQALGEIEKLTTIREVHGLSDIQYVENFRFHQERISGIINKSKEK